MRTAPYDQRHTAAISCRHTARAAEQNGRVARPGSSMPTPSESSHEERTRAVLNWCESDWRLGDPLWAANQNDCSVGNGGLQHSEGIFKGPARARCAVGGVWGKPTRGCARSQCRSVDSGSLAQPFALDGKRRSQAMKGLGPADARSSRWRRRGRGLRRAQYQLFFFAHPLPACFGNGRASRCLRKPCLSPAASARLHIRAHPYQMESGLCPALINRWFALPLTSNAIPVTEKEISDAASSPI